MREVVCAKFAHTTPHGAVKGKSQIQEVVLYNLDVLISVGYRVKSGNALPPVGDANPPRDAVEST